MERIVIEVEKSFQKQIEIVSQSDKEAQFEELLNKAREEAAKNGLTEEILQQLLNEK